MRFLLPYGLRLGVAFAAVTVGAVFFWGPAQAWLADYAGEVAAARPGSSDTLYQVLAPLGDEALPAVVRNAASTDPEVADAARRALDTWLDVWAASSHDEAGRALPRKASLTLELLSEAAPRFTQSGGEWARRYARHALAVVDRTPPIHRATVIASADRLLRGLDRARLAPDPPARPEPIASAVAAETAPPAPTRPAPFSPTVAKRPRASADPAPPEPPPSVTMRVTPIGPTGRPGSSTAPRTPRPLPAAVAAQSNPMTASPPTPRTPPTADPSWRPDWRSGRTGEPEPAPTQPPRPAPPLRYADMTDRQLIAELVDHAEAFRAAQRLRAIGPGAPPAGGPEPLSPESAQRMTDLGRALAERGYRGVSLDHARALLADDAPRRLALVEHLLTDRTGDAARLLLLLARDRSAEVRVAAISALGTSPHRQLVEAAWSLALRDEDPRVGQLADGLRERLR